MLNYEQSVRRETSNDANGVLSQMVLTLNDPNDGGRICDFVATRYDRIQTKGYYQERWIAEGMGGVWYYATEYRETDDARDEIREKMEADAHELWTDYKDGNR